jgi:type I restriction enzyme S subunit
MPDDWSISTLGNVSDISAGGDKPKNATTYETETNKIPIYSNGITNEGLYGFTDKAKIFDESVTVSARGTIGYVCLRQSHYVPIVRLITLIPHKQTLSAKYLYLWLKQLHITGTGTTQQQLTVPDFKKTEIFIPNTNVMKEFTDIATSIFNHILDNKSENQRLATLRDTLLPKLMNGEIDVSNVQI